MPALAGIIILIIYFAVFGLSFFVAPRTTLEIPKRDLPLPSLQRANLKLEAASAVVIDTKTNARVFDYNGDQARPIASLTKLMTALVWLDHNPGWDKTIVIAKEDLRGGAKANLFVGDRIKLADLFKAGLISSDNTAMIALVRASGLSENDFVAAMNEKVKTLRLGGLVFSDPTGLDPANKGSAVAVAKLAEAAFKRTEIAEALALRTYRFSVSDSVEREVKTTNQLIGRKLVKSLLVGGKTGHLDEAGYCFAGIFQSGQREFITAVLGAPEDAARFSETLDILDWTLRAYLWDNTSN